MITKFNIFSKADSVVLEKNSGNVELKWAQSMIDKYEGDELLKKISKAADSEKSPVKAHMRMEAFVMLSRPELAQLFAKAAADYDVAKAFAKPGEKTMKRDPKDMQPVKKTEPIGAERQPVPFDGYKTAKNENSTEEMLDAGAADSFVLKDGRVMFFWEEEMEGMAGETMYVWKFWIEGDPKGEHKYFKSVKNLMKPEDASEMEELVEETTRSNDAEARAFVEAKTDDFKNFKNDVKSFAERFVRLKNEML